MKSKRTVSRRPELLYRSHYAEREDRLSEGQVRSDTVLLIRARAQRAGGGLVLPPHFRDSDKEKFFSVVDIRSVDRDSQR